MKTFEVRLATTQDIPTLNEPIPLSARALSAGSFTERQIDSAIANIFGVDSQLIADGAYFVVTADEQIVGCGGWSKRKTLCGGDQMKAAADELLDPAHDAARIRAIFAHSAGTPRGSGRCIVGVYEAGPAGGGFRRKELDSALPGEPLYAAMGNAVTERFDIPLPDGEALPAAHIVKALV